jgi:hypothetical protein
MWLVKARVLREEEGEEGEIGFVCEGPRPEHMEHAGVVRIAWFRKRRGWSVGECGGKGYNRFPFSTAFP